MRAKTLVIVSLVLNVALAVGAWALYQALRRAPREVAVPYPIVTVTNAAFRVAKTNLFMLGRALSWRDLESTNYESFVLNLRSVGCPESTLRDIILADVNQLFARRRRDLLATTNDMKWWRSDPDPAELEESMAREQAIENERRTLLTRLLGTNWEHSAETEVPPVTLAGPVLGALSAEQKSQVQQILARSQVSARDFLRERQAAGETVSPAELALLRERTRAELEKTLNAEQLEEFLLRYSHNANQLREELRSFNASPEEYRKLFAAVDPIDRQLQLLEGDDEEAASQREELRQQREELIRLTLTPERFETYRVLTDSDYRAALVDAQQAGASPQAGRTLFEVNRAVAAERERIAGDPMLTAEEKEEELRFLEEQMKTARALVLGQTPPPQPSQTPPENIFRHRAGPHDTLAGLALYYRVPLEDLLRANPGLGAGLVQPGETIKVPDPSPLPWQPGIVPAR